MSKKSVNIARETTAQKNKRLGISNITGLPFITQSEIKQWNQYLLTILSKGMGSAEMPKEGFEKVRRMGIVTLAGLPTPSTHYRFIGGARYFFFDFLITPI